MRTYKTQWVASRFEENVLWTLTDPRIFTLTLTISSSHKARPIYVLQTVYRIKEGDIYNTGLLFLHLLAYLKEYFKILHFRHLPKLTHSGSIRTL